MPLPRCTALSVETSRTGRQLWRVSGPVGYDDNTGLYAVRGPHGPLVVVLHKHDLTAYSPTDGHQVWHIPLPKNALVDGVVDVGDGLAVQLSGAQYSCDDRTGAVVRIIEVSAAA